MDVQVAILGGGLAGLHAARLLGKAGVECVLLEARDRLGGRIVTVDSAGDMVGVPGAEGFDLGPSWYWPQMQPAIAALVAGLGLQSFAQNSAGDVVFERMSRESAERYRGLGADQQSMRLVGGTAALVSALARDLAPESVRLGAQVTAMALTHAGVELTFTTAPHGVQSLRAQQVVAALPPRLFEATVALDPAPPPEVTRRWREMATWMAPHAKVLAIYDRPFWREAGLSGTAQSMVGPMVEMHDATDAAGHAALFGFLGVPAEQRAAIGEEALISACLAQFGRIFGAAAETPRATLFKDWAADPLTATMADRAAGGHPLPGGKPWITGPWARRLSFAGSETSDSEPGYLSGAVTAAERATAETVAALETGGRIG